MAETTTTNPPVDFRTEPAGYKHWKLTFDGPVATLAMDVREDGGLRPGYELKLNSYDLGGDIELYGAVQRLRFEHPEVGAVVITSGKERIFCAGANIRMLSQSSHGWKVNFCKFTNETRNAIEEATGESRQVYLTAVNGPCAGGATSSRSRRTGSSWPMMATPPSRCRRCRFSRSFPGPAGSRGSWTSVACAATAPTSSAPPRRGSRASAPPSGGWGTTSCRPPASPRACHSGR